MIPGFGHVCDEHPPSKSSSIYFRDVSPTTLGGLIPLSLSLVDCLGEKKQLSNCVCDNTVCDVYVYILDVTDLMIGLSATSYIVDRCVMY